LFWTVPGGFGIEFDEALDFGGETVQLSHDPKFGS
jgi:hypothetical protein